MDEQIRAKYAQDLLDNPVFQEALEQVTKGISREMDNVKPDDKETSMGLVMLRQGANRVVKHIIEVAESPKISEFNAKMKRKRFF